MTSCHDTRSATDRVILDIADYVKRSGIDSRAAYETATLCLLDSMGCALLALGYPACAKLIGPIVPGATLSQGARVPGTNLNLDPVHAAFNLGCMIRWLDYNDTWLAAEWGHPSDNLGGILTCADYISGQSKPHRPLIMRDVLVAVIKAYEIQGVLALENSFNRVGLDHVILVRVATAAVATDLLGGTGQQVINALSNAWIDGGALRTYRHGPNTGSRKSWAAGDATSRGLRLALLAMAGEMGYATALSQPTWGFQDALFRGQSITLARPLGSYVIENILFKISYPAEFHAQTAVEAAIQLHPLVHDRLGQIACIKMETQESAKRIIDKTGPLTNPADRDHCLQYMVAMGLIHGTLTADHYLDESALDRRIDPLRHRMQVKENPSFSRDYLDPLKRSIANAIQVFFNDGSQTPRIEVQYPIGHRRRRAEGLPFLRQKLEHNLSTCLSDVKVGTLLEMFDQPATLESMPVRNFLNLLLATD